MQAVIRVKYSFQFAFVEDRTGVSASSGSAPREGLPTGNGNTFNDFPVPDETPHSRLLDVRGLLPDEKSFRKALRTNAVKIILNRYRDLDRTRLQCNIAITNVDTPTFILFRSVEESQILFAADTEAFAYLLSTNERPIGSPVNERSIGSPASSSSPPARSPSAAVSSPK